MKNNEQTLSTEELYKKNLKKAKIFKILSPIVFWVCLLVAVVFIWFMLRNSIGNIVEIIQKLDKDKYTGEQIAEHYQAFIAKYGEWKMLSTNSIQIQFINIGKAFFNGIGILFLVLVIVFIVLAFVASKLVFPLLIKNYENSNQNMVNIAMLNSNDILQKQEKKKEKQEDWF